MITDQQPTAGETALDGLVPVTSQDGTPLITNPGFTVLQAHQKYREMVTADQDSRLVRVRVQMECDGARPYSPGELTKRGLADIANINFGFLFDALKLALAPYLDLIDSSERIASLPVTYGDDPEQQKDWQDTIEVEITRLITQSEGFDYLFNCLCHQFILHGISAPYYSDPKDFEWTVGTVADFLMPRHTRAMESAVEIVCIERFYLASELFQRIQKVEVAREEGWNVEQTWEIIKTGQTQLPYFDNPERIETDLKDNDLQWAGRSRQIRAVIMYVKSLDGRISQYMFDADGTCKDFMYKRLGKFEYQSQAFTLFTYGVGQNEFYHGIRGLGAELLELVRQMNEIWSAFLDAIRMNGKMVLKVATNADLRKLALVQFGHFIVPPPGSTLEPFTMPDLSKSMMPGLNLLGSMLQQKSAQYTAPDQFNSKQSSRLKAIAARMEEVAHLSVQHMNCFYQQFEKLIREQITRIIRKDWAPTDPNYKRVMAFYKRCERQGVPREAIHTLDMECMSIVRAVGAGSKAARKLIFEELKDPISKCDEDGQYQYTRDQIRAIAGTEAAERYAPRKRGLRPPQDKVIAQLENGLMDLGQKPAFEPNQLHPVHADEHLKHLDELIQESEQMVQQGQEGIEAFQKAPVMKAIYDHTKKHIDMIPEKLPDGQNNERRALLNEAYQQTGEAVNNNLKHYLRLLKQQNDQAQQQQGQQGQGQPSADAQATIAADQQAHAAIAMEQAKFEQAQAMEEAKHQAQMRRQEEIHQQKLRQEAEAEAEKIRLARASKDALTAAEISAKMQKAA